MPPSLHRLSATPDTACDPPRRRRDFHIAIICALPLEYDAVSLLVDEFWDQDGRQFGRTCGDTNTYRNGRMGMHDVVLLVLPNMGKAAVAGSAASLRTSYSSLKLAFLVGVCGGVPNPGTHEAHLGDVVLGEGTIQYDFGRQYPGEFIAKETVESSLGAPNKDMRSLIAYLKTSPGMEDLRHNAAIHLEALQDAAVKKQNPQSYRYPGVFEDKLFLATYPHKHRRQSQCGNCCGEMERFCDEAARSSCAELGCDDDQTIPRPRLEGKRGLGQNEAQRPEIFIGRIASGDTVMKSGHHRDQIAKQHKIIAFEMEGAGIWDEIPCAVVKGICDYADAHKNKVWQPFAAATAAAVVKAILGRYSATDQPERGVDTHVRSGLDRQDRSRLLVMDVEQTLLDAIHDFQSILTAEQRDELHNVKAVPDADFVLVFTAQLDSRNRQRKGPSVASRLHSILQSVRDFAAVLETLVSSRPGIAGRVWGSVKLTILVASNFVSYYEPLSKIIMNLGRFCPRVAQYQIWYPTSRRLQKALCNFYASIVRFCRHVVKVTQQPWPGPLFSGLSESLHEEFRPDTDNVQRSRAKVEEELCLAKAQADFEDEHIRSYEREEASHSRWKLKSFLSSNAKSSGKETSQVQSDKRRDMERRQRLLDSLSTHDYLTALKQSRRKRYGTTTEWLFHTTEFHRWANDADCPLLWCSGKIGSGKTILTSSVIDHILTQKRGSDVPVCFFFVQFDNQKSREAEAILKSIIRQALDQSGFPEEMEPLLEKVQSNLTSDFDELFELLRKITMTTKMLYIIIDGLDECEKSDRDDLLGAISSLARPGSNVKLFLASRDSISREITRGFSALEHLSMSCPSAQLDIATYVEGTIQEKLQCEDLIVGDPSLIEEIKQALMRGSDGMFLWVAFLIDELVSQHCDDDIRKAIHNLPKSLTEIFNRAIDRIISRGNAKVAQQAFQWIAAARVPLSLDQLREVMFAEVGQQHSRPERFSNDIYRISSWCENLVHVDEERNVAQFAHQTVRIFFLEEALESRLAGFRINLEDADHHIGEICVTYLNFNDFKTNLARRPKPLPRFPPLAIAQTALGGQSRATSFISTMGKINSKARANEVPVDVVGTLACFKQDDTRTTKDKFELDHPFLSYASSNWITHTKNFQKDISRTWNAWETMIIHGHALVQTPWKSSPDSTKEPHLWEWAYEARHYALMWLILHADGLEERRESRIGLASAREGDIRLLDIILEVITPSERNLDDALREASKGGHIDVVERLLAAGANVNTPSENTPSDRFGILSAPLQAAVVGGHLHIVERLLAAGADVSSPLSKFRGQDALQAAAERGHLMIVERLLAAGADVNFSPPGFGGWRALQAAAKGGHLHIVERLLTAGADVKSPPAESGARTALQVAAEQGHLDIVERLLAAGTDVICPPSMFGSKGALQAAAEGGHRMIVERLLAAGADASFLHPGPGGWSTLRAAFSRGDHLHDTIERYLATRADVNPPSTESEGRSALQADWMLEVDTMEL